MKKDKQFVILQGLKEGNRFFTNYTPGQDYTKLEDGTVAYRILGYANSVDEAHVWKSLPSFKRTTMTSDISKLLSRAATLINKGFVKGCLATNEIGLSCSPNAKEATCFCMLGALMRAKTDLHAEWYIQSAAEGYLRSIVPCRAIGKANDTGTKTKAVKWMRAAAKLAKNNITY